MSAPHEVPPARPELSPTLAALVLEYLTVLLFSAEENIDQRFAEKLTAGAMALLREAAPHERESLGSVAAAELARLTAGRDEYGYNAGAKVSPGELEFLSALASGEIFDGL